MKKVLIVGSQGYLGSVLTKYLIQNGMDCVGYDTGFFKNSVLYSCNDCKTIFKDARDINEKDIVGFDVVIHLAGISNDPMGKLEESKIYNPTRDYAVVIAKLCKKSVIV
jgi:nucleoside-diphosphate-sugar epimerase